jgi:hypothetical protein
MKNIEISFLSQHTNKVRNEAARRLERISLPKRELLDLSVGSTPNLISLEAAIKWLLILPFLIQYRIAKRKLRDFLPFGLEREFFTDRKDISELALLESDFDIKKPWSNGAWTKAVIEYSQQIRSKNHAATKFVTVEELVSCPMVKKTAALSSLDSGGYNTFWDHNNDGDYYPLLSKMDTPLNHADKKTLTPAEVIGDYIEIDLLVCSLTSTNHSAVHHVNNNRYYRVDKRSIRNDRSLLEERLYSFTQKYPVLKGCEVTDFGRYLLNHYSMVPSQIIKRFGHQILCVPFDLDDNADWLAGKPVPKDWDTSVDRVIASSLSI